MKNYTAIVLKEGKKETEVATVSAKNKEEAKIKLASIGKLICWGGGSKVYF